MKIGHIQLGFGTEIYNKISLNLYISGCKNNKYCNVEKCHNQKLRNFDYGIDYFQVLPIIAKICDTQLIECVVILGGEPLDADENEFIYLLQYIKKNCQQPIYIYTGYTYIQIKDRIKQLFDNGVNGICYGAYYEGYNTKKWIYNN